MIILPVRLYMLTRASAGAGERDEAEGQERGERGEAEAESAVS